MHHALLQLQLHASVSAVADAVRQPEYGMLTDSLRHDEVIVRLCVSVCADNAVYDNAFRFVVDAMCDISRLPWER